MNYASYNTVIDGKTVYIASTDPNSGQGNGYLNPNTSTPVAASTTFTPTADGTYTFRYKIALSQLSGSQVSNHNLVINKPTLTCS